MWTFFKGVLNNFIEDEALSRGAAISFFTVTSLAPVLLIVISIAGLAFGEDAARGAIFGQLQGLMGPEAAAVIQSTLANASAKSSGLLATFIGIATLVVTASGVFGELQSALNKIWKAEPKTGTVSRLIRARATSLGLVGTLGFLLAVSLVLSTALTAAGSYFGAGAPGWVIVLAIANFVVSFGLIALLFAAIYKVLPDCPVAWRDVIVGAVVTTAMFMVGKTLIGWYLGSSAVASTYGAAGGLMVLLIWVYYSTQIFLLGAEITKAYAMSHSSASGSAPPPRPAQVGFGVPRQKPLPPANTVPPKDPVRTVAPPARVAGVARIVGTTAFGVVAGLMIGRIARQLSGRTE
jgi:membrane protein